MKTFRVYEKEEIVMIYIIEAETEEEAKEQVRQNDGDLEGKAHTSTCHVLLDAEEI